MTWEHITCSQIIHVCEDCGWEGEYDDLRIVESREPSDFWGHRASHSTFEMFCPDCDSESLVEREVHPVESEEEETET